MDAQGTLTSIEDLMFMFCRERTSVTIPSSVKTIGSSSFYECTSLVNVDLPEGITRLYDTAFYGCESLKSITIPKRVTNIGTFCFISCSSLTQVTFEGDAPVFADNAFTFVEATVRYPIGSTTWTKAVRQNYGGTLTWPAYTKPYKITNTVSGAHVYWNAMPGVQKYGLWRKALQQNNENRKFSRTCCLMQATSPFL